jgi:hypothetical protein
MLFIFSLQTFFEGVQARVASGVKASEVSYQLAFSKQELRKVINQYPGSMVIVKGDITSSFFYWQRETGKERIGSFV